MATGSGRGTCAGKASGPCGKGNRSGRRGDGTIAGRHRAAFSAPEAEPVRGRRTVRERRARDAAPAGPSWRPASEPEESRLLGRTVRKRVIFMLPADVDGLIGLVEIESIG